MGLIMNEMNERSGWVFGTAFSEWGIKQFLFFFCQMCLFDGV